MNTRRHREGATARGSTGVIGTCAGLGLPVRKPTCNSRRMPFEIQHSGVTYASDGSEEEDAPRLRPLKLKVGGGGNTRRAAHSHSHRGTLQQRHPDRTGASGRASCAYQPYVPLGGMDSVFGLKITKRGQAVACTAPAGPGPTLYPSQGDEAISEDAPMAPHAATGSVARLASSVVNERNSGHGFGYSSIRDRLSAADSIIKAVRAGQHFFDHVQPKDALESARWGTRLADEECHAAAQRGSPRRELGGAGPCTPRGTRDGGRVKTAATSVSDKAARQPQPPLEVRLEHAFAELDAKLQPSPPVARGDRRHRSRQAGRRLRQRDRDGTPDVAGPKQPHRAADARSVASGSSSAVAHASRGVPTATTKQPPSMVAASAGRSMRHIAADNISVAGTATAASTISGSTGAGGGHGGGTPPAAPSHSVRTSRLLVEQLNDVLSTPLEMPGAGPPPVPQKPPNRAPAFVHYQPKKRPYSAEAIKMAAEDMATVKHTAMTPREPPSPSTAREDLQLARSLRSARLNANAVIPVAPKLPLLDLGMQHMKHVGKLTRACKQFAASQREKRRQLHLALDTFEFERPNTFRGKFQVRSCQPRV